MNVRDKATLFRLSYALLRRFAVIEIPVPDDATLQAIARAEANKLGLTADIANTAAAVFLRDGGLGAVAPLGPAMLRDLIAYVKQREPSTLAIAEGVELFVLPQLEGLDAADAKRARASLTSVFAGDGRARTYALDRFDSYFSHMLDGY